VVPPPDVRLLDADGREHALEHHVVQITPVRQREALCDPVGSGIAVMPFRAGLEEQLAVAAWFLETGRLIRQLRLSLWSGPTQPAVG
jgi:hypothetical protein